MPFCHFWRKCCCTFFYGKIDFVCIFVHSYLSLLGYLNNSIPHKVQTIKISSCFDSISFSFHPGYTCIAKFCLILKLLSLCHVLKSSFSKKEHFYNKSVHFLHEICSKVLLKNIMELAESQVRFLTFDQYVQSLASYITPVVFHSIDSLSEVLIVGFLLLATVYAIYFAGFLFSRISRVGCYSRIYQHAKIFTSDPDAWMRLVYAIHCSPRSRIKPLAKMS